MYNFKSPFFTQPVFSGSGFSSSNSFYRKGYHNPSKLQMNSNIASSNSSITDNTSKYNQTKSLPLPQSDNSKKKNNNTSSINHETRDINNIFQFNTNEVLFEIFGLEIYVDDVLLICILLFLYQEGIQDEYLFISLILLLLS